MTDRDLTRRSWIKAAAAAGGASMLAGCGGGGGNPTPEQEREIPDSVDKTFVTTEFNTIRNINFNPFDVLYHPNQSIYYLHNDLYYTSQKNDLNPIQEGEIAHPGLAEGIMRDGDVVEITIGSDYTWHDGDPVTADDVAVRWTLDKLAQRRNWERAFADCYVEDEETVILEVKPETNDDVLNDFVSNTLVNTKPSVFEQFLPEDGSRGAKAYEDVGSFEKNSLRGELYSFTIARAMEQEGSSAPVIGNGPWKMANKGERVMRFERFEDNPVADKFNYPEVKFEEYTTNQARYQALLSDNFSGLDLVLTQTVWDQMPDYYDRYVFKRRLGHGAAFNYNRFPDHRVRQALAFAINKDQVVGNSGIAEDLVTTHDFDSGLYADKDRHVQAFGEGFTDKLTRYHHDTERAAELLREVGWSKDDGQWYDENDEKVQITYKVPPTWSEFVNMAQTEVQNLNEFGIDAEFKTEELVVYYGQTMIQADYDIAHWWVGGARDFPWFAYNTIWNALQTIADVHKHPDVYEEVPGPIGEHNGDDTFSIDIQQYLSDIATTRTGTDEIRQLHREIAWAYNQMMPVYCLNEVNGCASLDTRNWAAPPTDSEAGKVFFPLSYMHNRGLMQAYK